MKYIILWTVIFVQLFSVEKLEKVTLQLQWYHQFQFAGYYMAKEKGFYAEEGLDVEIREYQADINPVDQVLSKKVHYATGRSSLILDYSKGKDVVLLASILQASPLVLAVRSDSEIYKIEDLNAKQIGGDNTISNTVSILAMLERRNIVADYIPNKTTKNDIENLIEKNVDAIAVYSTNEIFTLKKEGIKYGVFNPMEYNFNFYSDILFTSADEVNKHPQRTHNFKKASLKGWEYAFSHINETVQLILNKYNTQNKTRDALLFEAKKLKELAYFKTDKIGKIDRAKIEAIYNTYKNIGLVKNSIDLDKFVVRDNTAPIVRFTEEEKTYLKQKKEITVCGQKDWLPYTAFRGEKPKGIIPELLHEYARIIGIPITYIKTDSWDECLKKTRNREIDIVEVILKKPNTFQHLTPSKMFISDFLVLVSQVEKPYISNISDTDNRHVAILQKYKNLRLYIQKQFPNFHLSYVKDLKEGLKKVSMGQVDGYMDVFVPTTFMINKQYIKELKINARFSEFELEGAFGLRNDEPLLVSIFDKAIDALDPIKKREIINSWIGVAQENKFDFSIVWKILWAVVAVLLLVFYHHIRLKRENKKLKIAKKRLKKSEKALQTLNDNLEKEIEIAVADLKKSQEQAKLGSWKLDIVNNTLSWSDETYRIFGLDKTIKIKTFDNFLEFIHPDDFDKLNASYRTSLKSREPYEIIHRILTKDGKIKYVKENYETMFNSAGVAIMSVGTIQDISKEYLIEETLREKKEMLFKQARLAQMGEMISMIAHQWRQPLSAISSTTNALILKNERGGYEKKIFDDKLQKIADYSQHLSTTIDDFRNFFKTNKDKVDTSIEAVIEDVLFIIQPLLESKNIRIITDFKYNKKVYIYANELKQVLLNLLKNSEDILMEKKVVDPQITVRTFEEKDHLVLIIEDNGGGIDTAIIDKIFDPYFSTKTDKEGTGLGLYMSKIIVQEHCAGTLSVESSSNGAVFRIDMRDKEILDLSNKL